MSFEQRANGRAAAYPTFGALVVGTGLLLFFAAIVEIPFYANGIYRASLDQIAGSFIDWKQQPPFTSQPLQMLAGLGFPLLPCIAVAVGALAVWEILRRRTSRKRAVAIASFLLAVLTSLPYFLHGGRLVSWFLD
jgi:hypothetical protein